MIARLLIEALIAADLPAVSVEIGAANDRATWRVTYSRALTAPEQATAASTIAALDVNAVPADVAMKRAVRQAARALNGTPLSGLTAGQLATLVKLLVVVNGWVSVSGGQAVVDISASDMQAMTR